MELFGNFSSWDTLAHHLRVIFGDTLKYKVKGSLKGHIFLDGLYFLEKWVKGETEKEIKKYNTFKDFKFSQSTEMNILFAKKICTL